MKMDERFGMFRLLKTQANSKSGRVNNR
jgi:hypothetical protein